MALSILSDTFISMHVPNKSILSTLCLHFISIESFGFFSYYLRTSVIWLYEELNSWIFSTSFYSFSPFLIILLSVFLYHFSLSQQNLQLPCSAILLHQRSKMHTKDELNFPLSLFLPLDCLVKVKEITQSI